MRLISQTFLAQNFSVSFFLLTFAPAYEKEMQTHNFDKQK